MKKLSQAIALASVMTAGLVGVSTAQAEVSASASIATEYLWRGQTLGLGIPALSGSLDYEHASGLYVGAWVSSGDGELGTEYDLYFGFAGDIGDFGYDIGYASYLYPMSDDDDINDAADVYLGLSYKAASLYLYKSTDSDADGFYYVTSLAVSDSVSVDLGGTYDTDEDYMHLDLTYSFNDNIAFTVSQIVTDDSDALDASTKLVMTYTLPINF